MTHAAIVAVCAVLIAILALWSEELRAEVQCWVRLYNGEEATCFPLLESPRSYACNNDAYPQEEDPPA